MDLNPYARYLGDRDPMGVLRSTPVTLTSLAEHIPHEHPPLRTPAGKWTAREIVAHMADCELVFAFRVRQALAEDHPVIQPFDQDRWAAQYGALDLPSALEMFSATRRWNLRLFEKLTENDWERKTTHPERGTMTVRTIAETMAGHDINHLGQLERMAASLTRPALR